MKKNPMKTIYAGSNKVHIAFLIPRLHKVMKNTSQIITRLFAVIK